MKFYDFVDKAPALGKLVIVEGTERVLAERAVELLVERALPAEVREMNLERVTASELTSAARIAEAVQAMPFLASSRVVVVTDAQTLKAEMRRELWAVAQNVPEGNTLVIADLLSPRSQRPQPFGAMAGRSALRIDTTAGPDARVRYISEMLEALGATAEPRVVRELADGTSDLAAIRNDLQKLALAGKRITYADLQQETLTVEDPKAYRYAGALAEGKPAEALAIARDLLASDRGAAVPLIHAVAIECNLLWEIARGGEIPARLKWRERTLAPLARRIGTARARRAYERALAAFDAVVTGKVDDAELAVELLTAELSTLSRR